MIGGYLHGEVGQASTVDAVVLEPQTLGPEGMVWPSHTRQVSIVHLYECAYALSVYVFAICTQCIPPLYQP